MSGDTSAPVTPTQYWLEDIDLRGQRTWHGPVAINGLVGDLPFTGGSGTSGPAEGPRTSGQPTAPDGAGHPARDALDAVAVLHEPATLAAQPAVKLSIRQAGCIATHAELVAAGLSPA
jgi:hypothetical protein